MRKRNMFPVQKIIINKQNEYKFIIFFYLIETLVPYF